MTQNKKRLARFGIIAASFVMILALGIAVWAGFTQVGWTGGNTVKVDFDYPALLTVTCDPATFADFVDGSGDVITDGTAVGSLTFDEQNPTESQSFSDIKVTDPGFAITYTFLIECQNFEYFQNVNYTITATVGAGLDYKFTVEGVASDGTGDIEAGSITVICSVSADTTGLVQGATLSVSFLVEITQS